MGTQAPSIPEQDGFRSPGGGSPSRFWGSYIIWPRYVALRQKESAGLSLGRQEQAVQIFEFFPLSCVLQVVVRGLARVVVFEDDVRFKDNFRRRLEQMMEDVVTQKLSWDLM